MSLYTHIMLSLVALFCCTLAASVTASPLPTGNSTQQWSFSEIPPSRDLVWYPCFSTFFCAVLDVPLDYSKRERNRAYVPIIKYAATTTPYKGMVLTNPGGPGGSGVEFLQEAFETGVQVVGSNYDLVSWDPRGIGHSIPAANCTLSSDFTGVKVRHRSMDKIYGPELAGVYFQDLYQTSKEIGQECGNSIGASNDAGPHMTTATVVRDMISILDAFAQSEDHERCEDSSLLNYWGFSYGTMIGQTFASMFPRRLGRVVLDGVVSPSDYIEATGHNSLTFSDEVFSTFFLYCNLAGPSKCAFYTGSTPHDIFLRFEADVSRLNATYAFEQGWSNATAIELTLYGMKGLFFGTYVYDPLVYFPVMAQVLVVVETILPDLTLAKLEALEKELGANISAPITNSDLWNRAVTCTDTGGISYNKTLEDLADYIEDLERQSFLAGEIRSSSAIQCTGWPILSDYRFPGPFGGSTNNPILFVSNTLDPVTPIQNGQHGTQLFKGAELLTIEGTGHTSLGPRNLCGFGKINAFFQTGILPGKDDYCPLEIGPFNVTYTGPLEKRADLKKIQSQLKHLKHKF